MTEETKICETSGVDKDTCTCEDCVPFFMDVSMPLLEARNINELTEKVADLLARVNYLRNWGFEISMGEDAHYMKVKPPLVGGCYWAQCRGCGYPILVDQGEKSEIFCEVCLRIDQSKGEGSPRYYEDLFNYIQFNLESRRIPTGYKSKLPLTEEFCEAHSFDFKVIKQRLNATGGYDPGEVLMNSMWSIPWFDKLPMKLKEEDG